MSEREVLQDVGRPIPVAFTCPECNGEAVIRGETGREVIENERCVEMHVDVDCPYCGEPIHKEYDFRDDPRADFRKLDGEQTIPAFEGSDDDRPEPLTDVAFDAVDVGYELPVSWEPGDPLPPSVRPCPVGGEVLEDVGRIVPAKLDCSCGVEREWVDAESGKEVVDERGCIEMHVSWRCPECGNEFEDVRDHRDEPTIDPRRLPGYEES